jgi:hypothetical protein
MKLLEYDVLKIVVGFNYYDNVGHTLNFRDGLGCFLANAKGDSQSPAKNL